MEHNKQPLQAELLQGAEPAQASPVNDEGAAMVEDEISVSPANKPKMVIRKCSNRHHRIRPCRNRQLCSILILLQAST